jgi:hypothetical protein
MREHSRPELVRFVVFGRPAFETFAAKLENLVPA